MSIPRALTDQAHLLSGYIQQDYGLVTTKQNDIQHNTSVLHGRLHEFFSEVDFVSTFGALFVTWYTLLKMGCFVYTFKGVLTVINSKLPLGCLSTPMHV